MEPDIDTETMKTLSNEERIDNLISEIKSGHCVAFIGAGFSAPAIRPWDELLEELAVSSKLSPEVKTQVKTFLDDAREDDAKNPLFDREAAAELIKSDLKDSIFRQEVKNSLLWRGQDGRDQLDARVELLKRIPFDSVLTTNFDSELDGTSIKNADLGALLRARQRGWKSALSSKGGFKEPQVIALHGDINNNDKNASPLVFSRSGYRQLLFETSNYQSLIRAVFATKTVVFLGFSFSDAYLNLIRSEVLSMLYPNGPGETIAYAVMDDLKPDQVKYLENHEGISPITYCTKNDGKDHSGFQKILEQISNETDPERIAARLLSGRKVMWFDPNPENNRTGVEMLRNHMYAGNVIQQTNLQLAKEALQSDEIDLLITHWGYDQKGNGSREPNGVTLLRHVKEHNLDIPVLVFASGDFAAVNRSQALNFGALDYIDQFHDLFGRIEDVFEGAPTGK
jgi:CheY-like chemotaxis protein